MPGWQGKLCSNYQYASHNLYKRCSRRFTNITTIMIPRTSVVFFCLLSVAVAVFVSFLPDLWTNIFNQQRPQLSLKSQRTEPFSIISICSPAHDVMEEYRSSIAESLLYKLPELESDAETEVQGTDSYDVQEAARVAPLESTEQIGALSAESLAAVHQARLQLDRSSPRPEKASRLYRHALALSPRQPDLLNEYGEFLERYERDVRAADHHYCRALAVEPSHEAALFNRQRARPLVAAAEQQDWAQLSSKRDVLGRVPTSHRGLRRMKREDYVRHLHETAALEGNTFTLAETRALLETRMAINGRSIVEHNEILGLEAALSFINASLSSHRRRWMVEDVLAIHQRVLGHVDPLDAGRLRQSQVYVGKHVPPPPADLPELFDEFIDWLNSERAAELAARHPVELAARAHYKLVFIHPFYDGNGRTARLLMNYILMQAGYPPVSVRMADRQEYYRHLEVANGGDVRPFVRFVARCTERTLDEYLSAVSDDPAVAAVIAMNDVTRKARQTIVIGGGKTHKMPYDTHYRHVNTGDAMQPEP